MSTNKNRCPVCNGYKIESTVTFAVDFGFGVVVVRHVPATVCEQCSTEWIDDIQAEQLESIVADAKQKHSMVEISEFSSCVRKAS